MRGAFSILMSLPGETGDLLEPFPRETTAANLARGLRQSFKGFSSFSKQGAEFLESLYVSRFSIASPLCRQTRGSGGWALPQARGDHTAEGEEKGSKSSRDERSPDKLDEILLCNWICPGPRWEREKGPGLTPTFKCISLRRDQMISALLN